MEKTKRPVKVLLPAYKVEFEAEHGHLCLSPCLKDLLEAGFEFVSIEQENVTPQAMKIVLSWLALAYEHDLETKELKPELKLSPIERPPRTKPFLAIELDWLDKQYRDVSRDDMKSLLKAVNYFECPRLIQLAAKPIVDLIKGVEPVHLVPLIEKVVKE